MSRPNLPVTTNTCNWPEALHAVVESLFAREAAAAPTRKALSGSVAFGVAQIVSRRLKRWQRLAGGVRPI